MLRGAAEQRERLVTYLDVRRFGPLAWRFFALPPLRFLESAIS